jgi:maltooligosyltrehalose trehalohydrolase
MVPRSSYGENAVHSECGLGSTFLGGGLSGFLVWTPLLSRAEVHILSAEERIVPLEEVSQGYHYGVMPGVKLEPRYFYLLDGNTERPDPASKFHPEGVHWSSQIINPHFVWEELHRSGIYPPPRHRPKVNLSVLVKEALCL